MTKSEMEALCAEWLSERLDPEDKEELATFKSWMERRSKDPAACVTVHEVVSMWESMRENRKLH
jgi:hypothetical protein